VGEGEINFHKTFLYFFEKTRQKRFTKCAVINILCVEKKRGEKLKDMKDIVKPRYIKCPRCELNYIDANKASFCDVCLNEMKGKHDDFDDFDADEDELMELCPICGENMMKSGEECCDECKRKRDAADEEEPDPEKDDEWRSYLDDEAEDASLPEGLPPEDIAEDFGDEEEEEEEEPEKPEDDVDDFEYVSDDEIYNIYGDDDDDEDEDDDDDFDDDDDDVGVKIANRHEAKKNKSKSDK